MERYKNIKFISSIGIVFLLIVVSNLEFFSILGIGLFVFFGTKFFFELGHKIEIRDIMILIAVLQWIIGPVLSYEFIPDHKFYYMAVDIETYMAYVVPASFAFAGGLYFPIWNKRIDENVIIDNIKVFLKDNKNFDLILIVIGSVARISTDYFPNSLKFAVILVSEIRFIGLYFLLLNNRKYKWIIIIIVFLWLFLFALNHGMFHQLILWIGFFVVIYFFIIKPNIRKKVIIISSLLVLILVIQTVKHQFRKLSGSTNKTELFVNLVQDNFVESNNFASSNNLEASITRINQGWIVARIMRWTPAHEPFANGETIRASIINSLLPRFLVPEKTSYGGGRTNFERFTGKKLSNTTSMGLSLIGEAYANYGVTGGAFFLFCFGFFIKFYINQIYRISIKHPILLLFLPLLFLQVIKAETDFAIILNHLLKASLAVYIVFFGLRRFLGINT